MLPRTQVGQRTTWVQLVSTSPFLAPGEMGTLPRFHSITATLVTTASPHASATWTRCRLATARSARGPRRAATQARISTTHSGPSVRSPASRTTDRVAAASSQRSRRSSAASDPVAAAEPEQGRPEEHPRRHLQAVGRCEGGRVDEGRSEPDEQADEGPGPPDPGGQAPRGERQDESAQQCGHGAHGVEGVRTAERLAGRADHPVVDRFVVGRGGRGTDGARLCARSVSVAGVRHDVGEPLALSLGGRDEVVRDVDEQASATLGLVVQPPLAGGHSCRPERVVELVHPAERRHGEDPGCLGEQRRQQHQRGDAPPAP